MFLRVLKLSNNNFKYHHIVQMLLKSRDQMTNGN